MSAFRVDQLDHVEKFVPDRGGRKLLRWMFRR
jgi:hypothetical protein